MQFSHQIEAKNNVTHKSMIVTYVGSRDHFGFHMTIKPCPTQVLQKEMEEKRKN